MIASEIHRIATGNDREISASFFCPEGEALACVLIVPAMGTTQKFYALLAAWLASQGYLVATFDYSGTGSSRYSHLRKVRVNIIDWGRFDCSAMVDALAARLPGKPLYWVGHSLGAQVLAFVPNREKIARMVTIAAGSGYWKENSPQLKWRAWWLWYVVAPVSMRLFGYFPGKRLRKVGDLPIGVMEQWRRWCLDPQYVVGAEGEVVRSQFASVITPVTSISFADDEMMSARNTESLHGFYVNAPKVMKRLAPKDIGARRIGHFGFFRAGFERSLWQAHLLPELA